MSDDPGRLALDILLVEDDRALAEMYRIKLRAEGHRVEIASDGRSGLQAALERPPQLLLLDIRLPGIDGHELLARLRQDPTGTHVPVIVLSNFGEEEMVARSASLGALSHLIKAQTTPAELAQAIRTLLPSLVVGLGGA